MDALPWVVRKSSVWRGTEEDLPGKVQLPINSGERLRYWVTGSGGHGNPAERDPESVLDDV